MAGVPLGVLAVAAWMRERRGDEIRIADYHLHPHRMDTFEALIREFRPDVIGFSVYSISGPHVRSLSERAKRVLPEVRVVVGGPDALTSARHNLAHPAIDYVISGDGEPAFDELLTRLESGEPLAGIPGLSFRKPDGTPEIAGTISQIDDLDSLPILAYDLIDLEAYFLARSQTYWVTSKRAVPFMTIRGCPYRCAYCLHVSGRSFRAQSVDRIMREIRHLVERYDVREIQFFDDCFNYHRETAMAVLDAIASSPFNIRICFPRGLRGDLMDQEFVDAMCRAHAYSVCVPIETVHQRHLDYVNRTTDVEKIRDAIEMCADAGLIVITNIILGFPGETRQEIRESIDFAVGTRAHMATFLILNIFEGTDLARQVRRDYPDCTFSPYTGNFQSADQNLSEVDSGELIRLCGRATLRFHADPIRLARFFRVLPRKTVVFHLIVLFVRRVLRPFFLPLSEREAEARNLPIT